MVVGKVHKTERYLRYRLVEPSKFRKGSFRTIRLGREGKKGIIGRLKSTGKWKLQAKLVPIRKKRL